MGASEGEIDEGIEELAAGEGVADEGPCGDEAEEEVDAGGGEGEAEGELERGDEIRVGHQRAEIVPGERCRFHEEPGEGDEDDQGGIEHGEAHGEAEAGENRAFPEDVDPLPLSFHGMGIHIPWHPEQIYFRVI